MHWESRSITSGYSHKNCFTWGPNNKETLDTPKSKNILQNHQPILKKRGQGHKRQKKDWRTDWDVKRLTGQHSWRQLVIQDFLSYKGHFETDGEIGIKSVDLLIVLHQC